MSDALKASVEKLKQSTAKLNKITDDANQVIKSVEAFLNKELSVGIDAHVLVKSVPIEDEPYSPVEDTHLSYQRWEGKYRITVTVGIDPSQETTKPWGEWDRDTKLETIPLLPELLNRIAQLVDERVTAAEQALAIVSEVVPAMKGGK